MPQRVQKVRETNDIHHPLGIGQRLFLFRDDFALGGQFGVHFDVALPFGRNVVFVKNRFHGAFGDAGFAVDAFFGVDVEHLVSLVEALHWANNNAICVTATNTRLCDDVSHGLQDPFHQAKNEQKS